MCVLNSKVKHTKKIFRIPAPTEGKRIEKKRGRPGFPWSSHLLIFFSFLQTIVTGITHHRYKNEFITCGERVLLWDAANKAPKFSYDWSTSGDKNDASVVCVKFSPVETDLFGEYSHCYPMPIFP